MKHRAFPNKTLPPNARAIIEARNAGFRVGTVFIAHSWPSDRLRKFCKAPPFSKSFPSIYEDQHALATPRDPSLFNWRFLVGLAPILWAESSVQAAILLRDVAPLVFAVNPQLLQLWHVYEDPAQIEFLKLTNLAEVQHAA